MNGVIISTHTDGEDWASPAMRSTMEDIRDLGAGWVCVHPYAWIQGSGAVRHEPIDPARPPKHLTHPIRLAHELGLRIFIMPHIGYWGSPFSWRGDIAFRTDEEWARFFADYEGWVTALAEACREADGFAVGNELDKTVSHEAEWRRIIAAVRGRTEAPLTYAANWTHYREVPFWDALDVIGIQAYFPLAEEPLADSTRIEASWRRLMGELRAYAIERNRNIVFTELGYNRSYTAATRPWEYRVDGPDAEPFQAMCLRIALAAVAEEPSVLGAFLWKWFPNPRPVGRNFQLATPRLKQVITEAWKD